MFRAPESGREEDDGESERASEESSARARPEGPQTRIPDAVRAAVLAYARSERERGVKWREIAGIVGLSESVLVRWTRGSRRRCASAKLVPVRVGVPATSVGVLGGVTLVSPNGYGVEGLGIADALEALGTLA
jgi:hypothetical protein